MARVRRFGLRWLLLIMTLGFGGCVTSPPKQTANVCDIFKEKRGWYKDAAAAANRWDSDVAIIMAFMKNESGFRATARPPRKTILWVIPWFRPSNAYGYAQAKTETWDWYIRESNQRGARRKDFGDSADFIAWYNRQSHKTLGVKSADAYNLYLAYHEGHGGYRTGTYRSKAWLKTLAQRVQSQAAAYKAQLQACESELKKGGWWIFGASTSDRTVG